MEIPECCIRFSKYTPVLGPKLDQAAELIVNACTGFHAKVSVTGSGLVTSKFAVTGSTLQALLNTLRYYGASPADICYLWFGESLTWPDWLKDEIRVFERVYEQGKFENAAACLRVCVDTLISGVYETTATDAALNVAFEIARTDQAIKRFVEG